MLSVSMCVHYLPKIINMNDPTAFDEFREISNVFFKFHSGDGYELACHEYFPIFIAYACTYDYHYINYIYYS